MYGLIHPLPARGLLAGQIFILAVLVLLTGCQALAPPAEPALGPRLDAAIRVIAAPASDARQRARAIETYRDLVAGQFLSLLALAEQPGLARAAVDPAGVYRPGRFAELAPVRGSRVTEPGLHRAGLGLPLVGRIDPSPTAPDVGYHVPLTLVVLPKGPPTDGCVAVLVDPERVTSIRTRYGDLPVAMDLEAPLDATRTTGPGVGSGLLNLVRPGRFTGQPRIMFLRPFDRDKTPVILVHGLMSTPRMWTPLLKSLLADPAIRAQDQFGFFYYPTGQPVPLSALQLREALDDVVRYQQPKRPFILIGHSMGGILARAQVSRLTVDDARGIVRRIDALPEDGLVRRALVFAPRRDVSRAVFLFVPHRGSRLASSGVGAWGIRLIRLPDWLIGELTAHGEGIAASRDGRLPTSIHGLSPDSPFLQALDHTRPTVPVHTILGDRGRGDGATSSDGVVPYLSAHLSFAESEVTVPTGHGGFAHPATVAELKRILRLALDQESVDLESIGRRGSSPLNPAIPGPVGAR